jgi:aromatic-L-amino-acid decarboxylase
MDQPLDQPLHMSPDDMRELGHRVVDALVERWTDLEREPSWRGAPRNATEAFLREPAPEEGCGPDVALTRALRDILPLAGRVDHPRFFAFIPSSPTWPSVLADFLAAGFNIFQGTWLESAGPSQVELVVLDWFRDWLGLPEAASGVLTSGASVANLVAVVAAREAVGSDPRAMFYVGDQGHSSLAKAIRIAGIGPERLRQVPTDDEFRMDVASLRRQLSDDRRRGWRPVCVMANGGATNTGAIDPLDRLADLCEGEGLWLHVDAAYGGFAVLTASGRQALQGISRADSVTLDPHKWLFQPYEIGCVIVRDPALLEQAFRAIPEYLQDAALGEEQVNFADRGVQLTRAFRALKVWLSVQSFGVRAFRHAIDRQLSHARRAAALIEATPDLELLAPPSLGIVCFRFRPETSQPDPGAIGRLNEAIQQRIVHSGYAMMSSTRLRSAYALRLCLLNRGTHWSDVEGTLSRVVQSGRELTGSFLGG